MDRPAKGHRLAFGRDLERSMVEKDRPADFSPQAKQRGCDTTQNFKEWRNWEPKYTIWNPDFESVKIALKNLIWTVWIHLNSMGFGVRSRQWLREDVGGLQLKQAFADFKATSEALRLLRFDNLNIFKYIWCFLPLQPFCPFCQAAWDSFRPTVEATRKDPWCSRLPRKLSLFRFIFQQNALAGPLWPVCHRSEGDAVFSLWKV